MSVDIQKAHVSILRDYVSHNDPSIDRTLLTRRNCLAWLASHGIQEISQSSATELFAPSYEESLSREHTVAVDNNYDDIEIQSFDISTTTTNEYQHINYSGTHDVSYNTLQINENLQVSTLTIQGENILDLFSEILSDIRFMNDTLSLMRSNLDTFSAEIEQEQNHVIPLSMANVFSFEIVQNADQTQAANASCTFYMQSSILNIHMEANVAVSNQEGFSVRLPYPVRGKPYFRMTLTTSTGHVSTIGKLHASTDQLYLNSHLFSGIPMHVSIDGTYSTENFPDVTWITPMKFDERRDMYINTYDVYTNGSLSFEKGSMQWNIIEGSVKLNCNMHFRVFSGSHHITVNLPNPEHVHSDFSGYGSVLLLPDYRYTVQYPRVYVSAADKKMHIVFDIISYTTNVESVIVSTHIVYY